MGKEQKGTDWVKDRVDREWEKKDWRRKEWYSQLNIHETISQTLRNTRQLNHLYFRLSKYCLFSLYAMHVIGHSYVQGPTIVDKHQHIIALG